MDFIKLIIDGESTSTTCFLCFNLCDNGTNIYDVIDLQDKSIDSVIKTSLFNVIKYLFPSHDIIFSQACNDCVGDLKKIYCKFQHRNMKVQTLNNIVDIIKYNISTKIQDSKILIDIPILKNKINTENPEKKNQASYTACDMNFASEKIFDKSVGILHKNKSLSKICHVCGKQCENPKALKSHLNSHTQKSCPYCLKVLKTHAHFKRHVQSHTMKVKRKRKIKYYNCNSCLYKTMNKTDLESHKNKMHLNIRPYKCENCSKSFYKKSNLTAHEISHSKTNKLICELCGSNFSIKKTLIQHLKLHEGTRDYECEFCKRRFVTRSRRNEHVKRNHSKECHNCPYCSKKYTLRKDMNSHVKRVHQDILSMNQNFLYLNSLQN